MTAWEGRGRTTVGIVNAILTGAMIVFVSASPISAAQASIGDRIRMSEEIANYIHGSGRSNAFKAGAVELGPATVEGNFALADWRSADRKRHGQVSFFYACDHWNVGKISVGRPFQAKDLVSKDLSNVSLKTAAKLLADLKQLENQHVAYLKPAHDEGSC